ncbi:MAG: CotH kinase family protein [Chitinophagales bacterium]|nr:CotH kinase family protein [Chitinophagales bacterium]
MMHISDDGHRLLTGDAPPKDLYDITQIKAVELWFDTADWWEDLYGGQEITATMAYDGDTLFEKIGVRFKGHSSSHPEIKKSFNLNLNFIDSTQELHSYSTMNLNNGHQDPSFMREAIYENTIQNYIPGLAVNWVTLYLNGEYWGIYTNVEQPNKDFYKRWFLSNDGTNWRAAYIGDALNYISDDPDDYGSHYYLKSTEKEDPYEDLLKAIEILNDTTIVEFEDSIRKYFDLDRVLWFHACENLFTDKDSYVLKGGMDYFIYWDNETGRITPIEYDGNSCMIDSTYDIPVFKNDTNPDFPLISNILTVPSFRQRYLAHVRTILTESLNADYLFPLIDYYDSLIDSIVQYDPKKIFSYAQYLNELEVLKTYINARNSFCFENAELNFPVPDIVESWWVVNETVWLNPFANKAVSIRTEISDDPGIYQVNLFYATGIVGNFIKMTMYDDGLHNDELANDGKYGGEIPGYGEGTDVRFYVEAIADDSAQTISYDPPGAEHDVYYYKVGEEIEEVSTEEIYAETNFVVFPNPANSYVTILINDAGEYFTEIYTVSGNKIFSTTLTGTKTIDITHLQSGVYFLKIGEEIKKLIVLHD